MAGDRRPPWGTGNSADSAAHVHPVLGCGVYLLCGIGMEAEAMAASESFEEFYAATVGRLLGQVFLVSGDLHAAEEIVQEAFTRAAIRWARLRDYDVPEAWVRRVAMNLAADRARSLRRQARAMLRLGPPASVPAASVETLALVEALHTLPIRQRQAIVLHYLLDRPVEEVAQVLAVRGGTVKSLLARGRRALAARLGEGWADDSGPFPMAAFTWAHLLLMLKTYAETGQAAPCSARPDGATG